MRSSRGLLMLFKAVRVPDGVDADTPEDFCGLLSRALLPLVFEPGLTRDEPDASPPRIHSVRSFRDSLSLPLDAVRASGEFDADPSRECSMLGSRTARAGRAGGLPPRLAALATRLLRGGAKTASASPCVTSSGFLVLLLVSSAPSERGRLSALLSRSLVAVEGEIWTRVDPLGLVRARAAVESYEHGSTTATNTEA